MPANAPQPAEDEAGHSPMPLSRLLTILSTGRIEDEAYTVFTAAENARAVDDPICVLDGPVDVDLEKLVEIMPPYVVAEGLVTFCHASDAVDTIHNTRGQRPDAPMELILANLDYYLLRDTWMDLE
ncbi:hypothetical protein [Gordonia hydrophobica]|uniref:Uncharacterized protein n=1 Tax=Gordonia hydrophobica TaxID=40516 RepID=A0ABZ2U3Q8_9ACTN|nr:hypothetical protein [Gordonia hydrophobica]MBM7367513.1 hypothetical protein [Gordonia hydrophobica]